MGYFYMSNINSFTTVTSPTESYQSISTNVPINFEDNNYINQKGNFIMIRAHQDNDLLVQLYPSTYGVYIPAGELWAVDSLEQIEKIYVRKVFSATSGQELTTGKIQWMIGYK